MGLLMAVNITFQILEGIDKGRTFREMPPPVTIGREEGNILRLNDERVSRFHAKVQLDNGDFILTDLESTNGTRVNGMAVQIRRLRAGDKVSIGRSILLFGSEEEIAARSAALQTSVKPSMADTHETSVLSHEPDVTYPASPSFEPDSDPMEGISITKGGTLEVPPQTLPPLPRKLAPAQVARLSEILEFLHTGISRATDKLEANEEGTEITLGFNDWQRILAVQMLLARYIRAIADPGTEEV